MVKSFLYREISPFGAGIDKILGYDIIDDNDDRVFLADMRYEAYNCEIPLRI